MAKVYSYNGNGEPRALRFFCPGCECTHAFTVQGDYKWTWNNDFNKPTFSPSLLCNFNDPQSRCHLFLKDGMIQYLNDCYHKLAGQTIECPEWEE